MSWPALHYIDLIHTLRMTTRTSYRSSVSVSSRTQTHNDVIAAFEERKKMNEAHNNEISSERLGIEGDGNCMYRSILTSIGTTKSSMDNSVKRLREEAVDWVFKNWEEKYGENGNTLGKIVSAAEGLSDKHEYHKQFFADGAWGGEIEIYAISQIRPWTIHVFNAAQNNWREYKPKQEHEKSAYIHYNGDNHYDAFKSKSK